VRRSNAPLLDFAVFFILVIVGVITVSILKALLFLLPAVLVAVVVWFLTGSLVWGGLAFVFVTILSLLKKH
jgi:hypothetical protein